MDETAALELVGLKAIKLSPAHDRVQSRDSRSELTEHRNFRQMHSSEETKKVPMISLMISCDSTTETTNSKMEIAGLEHEKKMVALKSEEDGRHAVS